MRQLDRIFLRKWLCWRRRRTNYFTCWELPLKVSEHSVVQSSKVNCHHMAVNLLMGVECVAVWLIIIFIHIQLH